VTLLQNLVVENGSATARRRYPGVWVHLALLALGAAIVAYGLASTDILSDGNW